MSHLYILKGRVPVPVRDTEEWSRWFRDSWPERRVDETIIGDFLRVSTVFLGLDHGFGRRLQLFETMIFDTKDDNETLFCERCGTYDEAERMHRRAVAWAQAALVTG